MTPRPAIAILSANVLVGLGLKSLLERIIPMAGIECFTSFEALAEAGPERFFHFFVTAQSFASHAAFFRAERHRTILLTDARPRALYAGMHTLDIFTDEERLARDLTRMHRGAHPHMPTSAPAPSRAPLSAREAEVLTLVARGLINKEIAHRLGIGLTTVITHRRNIMEKLGLRSAAELVLYAATAGYVAQEDL